MNDVEREAYKAIQKFFIASHNMPTYKQLSEILSISHPTAMSRYRKLVKLGKLNHKGHDYSFTEFDVVLRHKVISARLKK